MAPLPLRGCAPSVRLGHHFFAADKWTFSSFEKFACLVEVPASRQATIASTRARAGKTDAQRNSVCLSSGRAADGAPALPFAGLPSARPPQPMLLAFSAALAATRSAQELGLGRLQCSKLAPSKAPPAKPNASNSSNAPNPAVVGDPMAPETPITCVMGNVSTPI